MWINTVQRWTVLSESEILKPTLPLERFWSFFRCLFNSLVWYHFVEFTWCSSHRKITQLRLLVYFRVSFIELLLGAQTVCQMPWIIRVNIDMKPWQHNSYWLPMQWPMSVSIIFKRDIQMLSFDHIFQNLLSCYRIPPLDLLLVMQCQLLVKMFHYFVI